MNYNYQNQLKLMVLLMLAIPLSVFCQSEHEVIASSYFKTVKDYHPSAETTKEVTKSFNTMKVTTSDKYKGQLVVGTAIAKMLDNSTMKSGKFLLMFLFNRDSQLIVVACNDKEIEGFVQATLNYKVIENHGYEPNRIYTLPVTYNKK